jgi:hypothetical protein
MILDLKIILMYNPRQMSRSRKKARTVIMTRAAVVPVVMVI